VSHLSSLDELDEVPPSPAPRSQQSRAGHHSKNYNRESHGIQLGNPMLAIKLGSGFWRRMVMPCCVCLNLLVPENASRRENEVGDEQLGYEKNGNECLHALEVA
jgi:hypothetical protein